MKRMAESEMEEAYKKLEALNCYFKGDWKFQNLNGHTYVLEIDRDKGSSEVRWATIKKEDGKWVGKIIGLDVLYKTTGYDNLRHAAERIMFVLGRDYNVDFYKN
jgi:hypothetical protein